MPSVCLDAGHGGKDSGATLGSRYEKNDVLKMVLKVGPILEKAGIKVYYTRKTDFYEAPISKATKANKYGVDFFASFHRNAANGSAKGYETLVYSNSGKAKTCADAANKAMTGLGFVNRGTKIRKDLTVLTSTKMPAVLFEMGFIDNVSDNTIYDKNVDKIANSLAKAIASAVGVSINSSSSSTASKTPATSSTTTKPASSTSSVSTVKVDQARSKKSGYAKGKTFKTTADLNLRSGAGVTKKVVKVLKKGSSVTWYGYYTKINGVEWYLVSASGVNGFVSSKYLA